MVVKRKGDSRQNESSVSSLNSQMGSDAINQWEKKRQKGKLVWKKEESVEKMFKNFK
jgi:hypothetical protein